MMVDAAKYSIAGGIIVIIGGVEITVPDDMENRHRAMIAEWEANGGMIEPYTPEPELADIISIPSVTFWERMTDQEAEQVQAAMQAQPFRTRQIFMTAQSYRSDHELWPLLQQAAIDLFGEVRAGELLAQP
ncbi:hypothetical protein [Pseudochrobactrum asaccharolyticum]|uniref:hypothetical protein n=1 Tax=Pseudochrobactrum asaccharolyticum TaxID=354351 RepID=UPI00404219B2